MEHDPETKRLHERFVPDYIAGGLYTITQIDPSRQGLGPYTNCPMSYRYTQWLLNEKPDDIEVVTCTPFVEKGETTHLVITTRKVPQKT